MREHLKFFTSLHPMPYHNLSIKRPTLMALSRISTRFVAAITIIPSQCQTIHFNKHLIKVCSRSSCPPPIPVPRLLYSIISLSINDTWRIFFYFSINPTGMHRHQQTFLQSLNLNTKERNPSFPEPLSPKVFFTNQEVLPKAHLWNSALLVYFWELVRNLQFLLVHLFFTQSSNICKLILLSSVDNFARLQNSSFCFRRLVLTHYYS